MSELDTQRVKYGRAMFFIKVRNYYIMSGRRWERVLLGERLWWSVKTVRICCLVKSGAGREKRVSVLNSFWSVGNFENKDIVAAAAEWKMPFWYKWIWRISIRKEFYIWWMRRRSPNFLWHGGGVPNNGWCDCSLFQWLVMIHVCLGSGVLVVKVGAIKGDQVWGLKGIMVWDKRGWCLGGIVWEL